MLRTAGASRGGGSELLAWANRKVASAAPNPKFALKISRFDGAPRLLFSQTPRAERRLPVPQLPLLAPLPSPLPSHRQRRLPLFPIA